MQASPSGRVSGERSARPGFHLLRVEQIGTPAPDTRTLAFAIPPALQDTFRFTPGQYLTLRTTIYGEDTRRSYSICSAPGEPLRVAVKRVEDGLFSTHAHTGIKPGQTIEVMPPMGRFTLPPGTAPRTVLAIAAGSGITPILSILKATLAQEPATRFVLLYGSRSTAEIIFRDELEALKDRYIGRLSIVHVLSREQQDIPVLNGRLDAEKLATLLPGLLATRPAYALLCGPGALIETASAALTAAGLPPETILSERFTTDGELKPRRPKPPPTDAQTAPFAIATIVSDGIRTRVPLREHEPVLDAALRAGLDLPYSCRGGMCSTCRARVTEGAVAMDVNYGLEPWETEAGFVLTCQAHARTPQVTVDFDHV